MNARTYLSIGQVLDLLKQEFPDLTISKIRFLESQGLLDPERTPSGYRKFYDTDVERLRFILRAQQEQYLPLKVIKGRLGSDDDGGDDDGAAAIVTVMATVESAAVGSAAPLGSGVGSSAGGSGPAAAGSAGPPSGMRPAGAARARAADTQATASAGQPDEVDLGTSRHPSVVGGQPTRSVTSGAGLRAVVAPVAPPADEDNEPASLTIEELATVSGLTAADISELERFGLITGRRIAGTTYYDGDCATIAAVAARFRAFGVEARHLRMYRTAVEREAGFFEQVVTPMLKQRNPQARRQAVDTLLEMSRLGSAMREAVLRLALREYTGGA